VRRRGRESEGGNTLHSGLEELPLSPSKPALPRPRGRVDPHHARSADSPPAVESNAESVTFVPPKRGPAPIGWG
jgi:hypothetical protein